MSWKEMIQVERGADITEMEAPIPNTIGEGFSFYLREKQYTTKGEYTKGKRDVEFHITSYIGYCGGIEIPNEYQSFKASIVRPLTKEEAADTERWEWYKEGDKVEAFCSLKELNKCIETIRQIFPEDKWNVVINRNY